MLFSASPASSEHPALVQSSSLYSNLTIIVPTLNEAESIGFLLRSLHSSYPGANVIIADDGSTDRTADIVREIAADSSLRIQFLDRSRKVSKGLTASVLDGIEHTETDYFIVMDGDLQHPPGEVKTLFSLLLAGPTLASGVRRNLFSPQPWYRSFLSLMCTYVAHLSLFMKGRIVRDPMSGFFGGKTLAVRELIAKYPGRFEPKGYKVYFELIRLLPRNATIQQFQYDFGHRPGGHSKISWKHGMYFFRSLLPWSARRD